MEFATIPYRGREVKITLRERTSFVCKVDGGQTAVKVEVTYIPGEKLIELDSFAAYLDALAMSRPWIVEEFASALFEQIESRVQPKTLALKVCGKGRRHGWVCAEVTK